MSDKRATSSVAHKAKALPLHIGPNAVSGAAYAGWDGPLVACEFDANDMAAIAQASVNHLSSQQGPEVGGGDLRQASTATVKIGLRPFLALQFKKNDNFPELG